MATTTISPKFQVVIPKDVREKLHLISGQKMTGDNIRAAIPRTVRQEEHDRLVELVLKEFESLYEGNIARFGVRSSEFTAWQDAVEKE